uniref:Glycine cleavage system H protein n=1 Tax=Triticum urartu TaxID=4572 RepID=A0A8R7UQS2_TRIUA
MVIPQPLGLQTMPRFICHVLDLSYVRSLDASLDAYKQPFSMLYAIMELFFGFQDHLGDVVYVELPEVGASVSQGTNFGAVESVKATSDINSPVSGEVIAVNDELLEKPALVNGDPYEGGWIIKVKVSDAGELNSLMDDKKYSKFCEEEDSKH